MTLRAPRGGMPPPATAVLPDGTTLFLAPLADDVTRQYGEEFPDTRDRYGDAWRDWCVHDTQFLVGWAALGDAVLEPNLRWLAGVLSARDFPLARLARTPELAADAVADQGGETGELAARLRAAAATVR